VTDLDSGHQLRDELWQKCDAGATFAFAIMIYAYGQRDKSHPKPLPSACGAE